jgi:monooxygenase
MHSNEPQPVDVIIVGAGISGISAACHLEQRCPGKRYRILEARENIGGTWDLFRYPGIRSDSDMHTFGFDFKPWTNPKALADGPSILEYLTEAVAEYGIEQHIEFGVKVTAAAWDSSTDTWAVTTENTQGETAQFSGKLLFMCSGYYNYDEGYTPEFTGLDNFSGNLVHPQHWPQDLDYRNKKVAVIGSGATAVTIVPAMANDVEHITMIQRSPTYVVSLPGKDKIANLLRKLIPETWAYAFIRWRNVRFQNYIYKRSRNNPGKMKAWILKRVRKALGSSVDVDKHFTPSYDPWTQRLCLVPDSDLFHALKSGKAEVRTGQIKQIEERGVRLEDGSLVECDILITATGLKLQVLGGARFFIDDQAIDFHDHFMYQGMMFSNVPNLIQTFGYINASWTLRADLNSKFVCDVLNKMDATGSTRVVPVLSESEQNMQGKNWVTDFNPGYFKRAFHLLPKQGDHAPWQNTQNYLLDKKLLKNGPVADGVLQFLGNASSSSDTSDTAASSATEQAA